MFPEVLSTLQQELKLWHDKLSHLHPKNMFRLEKMEAYHQYFYTWRMMCLFVHYVCFEQQGGGKGKQKGRNQGPQVNRITKIQDMKYQSNKYSQLR